MLSFAVRLGLVLLADRAARQLRALGLVTPGFPVSPAMLADVLAMPEGTLATVEQIERFDIGTLYLDAQDFSGAVARLDGVEIISARNNRAMALFHLGRIDEAMAGFMASWEADQGNLFALGWMVRLRLYRGDEVGAQGLTIPLAAATARRLDDALLQLDALLLLRQDAAARDAFTRSKQSRSTASRRSSISPMICGSSSASRLRDSGRPMMPAPKPCWLNCSRGYPSMLSPSAIWLRSVPTTVGTRRRSNSWRRSLPTIRMTFAHAAIWPTY
ncbi:hypothetical protein [Thiocapsa rosea]|uniref:Tetratricopeptide repeat protein n=1 Tax=Thiocapsa rosea TaxID=69360 RepID=A0A495V5T6_9GAMM|nr:hypothetical protein [Thiocapsa rosea]RKT44751.1 hypothetical protein BDD21_2150 [Thiocapsa rosea]